jgi:hypothetical protein
MPRLTQSSSAAPLDGLPVSQLVDGAKRIVDRTREALVTKFGWTHLEVSIVAKPALRPTWWESCCVRKPPPR